MASCSPSPYPPSTVHSLLSCFSCAACSQRLMAPLCWQILIWLFQFCYIPFRSTIIAAGAVARSVTWVGKLWILNILLDRGCLCLSQGRESHSGSHHCYAIPLHTAFIFLDISWWVHLSKILSEADGSFPYRKWDFSITFHLFQSKHLFSPG